MPTENDARLDRLLVGLQAEDFQRVRAAVELPQAHASHVSGDPRQYLHLPTTAVLAPVCMLEDGTTIEAAVAGFEGTAEAGGRLQAAGLIR